VLKDIKREVKLLKKISIEEFVNKNHHFAIYSISLNSQSSKNISLEGFLKVKNWMLCFHLGSY